MNRFRSSYRLSSLVAGLVVCSCVAPGVAQSQQQPQQQPKQQQRPQDQDQRPKAAHTSDSRIAAELEADADAISRQFQINGFTLTKAIKAAEDKCGGTAIAAMAETKGGNQSPCVKVAVLDSSNTLKCVTVGMDGQVMATKDWSSEQFSYGSQSSHASSRMSIVKASDVIGKNVVNAQGEDLGEIEDLAIDPRASRVGYAVLSFGGILGAGDKLFAVPWTVLKPHGTDKFVINVSKERLQNAPGFVKAAWPDMHDLTWNETVYGYYQQPYYWDRDRDMSRSMSERRPLVYKASEIMGMNVHNRQGESLGEVEGIALDPNSGDVRYAVVGVGGFLGIGERYIAVPWSAFDYNSEENELILDVTKERVKSAPGFDKNNWPDFGNQTWGGEVHRYYNREPYWNRNPSTNTRMGDDSRN